MSTIAKEFGVTVQQLKDWNPQLLGMNERNLRVGMTLEIKIDTAPRQVKTGIFIGCEQKKLKICYATWA